ncbi:MAG: hypothetical protein ACRDIV_17530 [Ktedonobacteraceae bacterium]
MITYCVRKVKSWGDEGWAICQLLGPTPNDYVLLTNDETRPKYGLFAEKKQADGMLAWLEHEQLERIKAYLEEELRTITAHVPEADWTDYPEYIALSSASHLLTTVKTPAAFVEALKAAKARSERTVEQGINVEWRKEEVNYYQIMIDKLEEL